MSRVVAAVALAGLASVTLPAQEPPAFEDLPDWSGAWVRSTGGFFESTPDQALDPPPPRDSPRWDMPFTPEFEAIFQENLQRIAEGRYPDPISFCGTPSGWPRMLQLPDAYEFVIRPEQTWILSENGPNVVRVYTDGRDHPEPDLLWNTFTGNNVGRWEGDTLVFHSTALKGVGSTILTRNGWVYSDALETDTRIRLIEPDRLLVTITLTDPVALTRPWTSAFTYERLPEGSTVYDYVCTENNRNPIAADGRTLTLDTDGNVIDAQGR